MYATFYQSTINLRDVLYTDWFHYQSSQRATTAYVSTMEYKILTVSIPASKKSHTMPMISLKSNSGEDKYDSSKDEGLSLMLSLK